MEWLAAALGELRDWGLGHKRSRLADYQVFSGAELWAGEILEGRGRDERAWLRRKAAAGFCVRAESGGRLGLGEGLRSH